MAERGSARRQRARGPAVLATLAVVLLPAAQDAGARSGAEMALVVAREATAPQIVAVAPEGADGLTVRWQSRSDAMTFRVVAATGDDRTRLASVSAGPDETRATVTGLHVPAGQPITVWVEADMGGWAAASQPQVAQLAPAAVATVQISAVSAGSAAIEWAWTEHATAYDVQVSTDSSFVRGVRTHHVEGQRLQLRDLPVATQQFVRVRPSNGALTGSFSPTAAFMTASGAAPPRTAPPRTAPPRTTLPVPTLPRAASSITTVRVGTWNVCAQACSGYAPRARLAAQRLAAADVDVFALQEAGGKRLAPLTDAIFGRGSNGYVRASGGDKRGFVFYRADQYVQGGGGHVDLGDDRHMSWARLTDRQTGASFVVAGIHLESGKDGVDGKRASETRVALAALARVAGGLPTVLAGDFNTGPHRGKDTPSALMAAAGLVDTRTRSVTPPVGAEYNTAHSWKPSDLSRHSDHIDRIMVTGQIGVSRWKQLLYLTGDRYTTPLVSDHNAITADLTLAGR